MMSTAIETRSLRKVFGETVAVADLSLTVQPGEVFGFLGPNGAGKTTAVKMLLGLVHPTSGEGELLGAPLGDPETRRRVGFLPEHFRFHDWLTAREFLCLHADLYHMARPLRTQRIAELLELVGLAAQAHQKLRTFSKGMLQRIGLAQALLNDPDLVILDEPTSGLDPLGRRLVRGILQELRGRGAAVFLSSHYLSEVEVTCDRVAFINDGLIVHVSSIGELMDGETVVDIHAGNLTPAIADGLARWGRPLSIDGGHISLAIDDETVLPKMNRYLVEQGVDVYALQPRQLSLEELFLQVVGRDEDV